MTIHQVFSGVPYDSNIFLVKGDRNVLIDTGTGQASSTVIAKIKQLLDGEPLHFVILTHCHTDHAGGLGSILEEFGSTAYAMSPDSDRIRNADPTYTLSTMFGIDIEPQPVTDIHDGDLIDIGAHKLRILSSPGHTEGGLCVYDEATGALFSGDTMFAVGIGRTDFPSGDFDSIRKSIFRISNIDIIGVYPGHGDCSERYGSDCVKRALIMVGEFN